MIISFDFDDTLTKSYYGHNHEGLLALLTGPDHDMIQKLRDYAEQGHAIVIVTYRHPDHENPKWVAEFMPNRIGVRDFVQEHDLPVEAIYFTAHQPKGPTLKNINATLHYDDCEDAIRSAEEHGITGILVKRCVSHPT